jgi:hypothetical protein
MTRRSMTFRSFGLEQDQVYLLGAVGEDGELLAINWFEHRELGRVLWVFSSPEEAEKFVAAHVDKEQAYKDYLNREEGQHLAAALRGKGATHNAVLPTGPDGLAPILVGLGIETVSVDAGSEDPFSRMYQVPVVPKEEDG